MPIEREGLSLDALIEKSKTVAKIDNFFDLGKIDPNTVTFQGTPQSGYEFSAKTTDDAPNINAEYAAGGKIETHSVTFELNPAYGPRFTKAFKHAVELSGGKPSKF